ncbi:hypothetical protein [Sorangium cellulosum]|uniref:Secreted protein n=1 Tax=Sorangium cellulosum TaxID=56 RepID=A0A150QDW4_SORCE|nr:hypothetical protein [Sorangium cellulosum]KYF66187.1 hypothetical protein BE15_00725 [Sorangium cellulosum]
MVWSSWFMRRARWAVMVGAAAACLSLPGRAAAQEAMAPTWEESERPEEVAERRERAALLATHFHDATRLHSSGKALPILFGGLGAASLAAVSLAGDLDAPLRIVWASGSATMLAGGLVGFAAPETYRRGTLATAGLLSQGSLWLGFSLLDSRTLPRMTPVVLSAGYYLSGALSGLNLVLSSYTPVSRLRADHALVATPAWRARLSGAQVAGIERDLLGTAPAIPSWAIHLPVALGGVAAALPALDPDLPESQRLMSVTTGLLTCVWSFAMLDVDHPAQSYQQDLRRAGLSLAPSGPEGAAGLTVSGEF